MPTLKPKTPGYSHRTRRYRVVGIETQPPRNGSERERVTDLAARGLAALLAQLGAPYDRDCDGKRTHVAITTPSGEVLRVVEPAEGRYRVIGLQPLEHQCEHCDRRGSVKHRGRHYCTEHGDRDAVVWALVRRTRAAIDQGCGEGYAVSVQLACDPRNAWRHE